MPFMFMEITLSPMLILTLFMHEHMPFKWMNNYGWIKLCTGRKQTEQYINYVLHTYALYFVSENTLQEA
jgi:hypothetical protein